MEDIESRCASLRAQIAATEAQLAALKKELEAAEKTAAAAAATAKTNGAAGARPLENGHKRKWPLSGEEYKRYGRQMIVPQIGLQGRYPGWIFDSTPHCSICAVSLSDISITLAYCSKDGF